MDGLMYRESQDEVVRLLNALIPPVRVDPSIKTQVRHEF